MKSPSADTGKPDGSIALASLSNKNQDGLITLDSAEAMALANSPAIKESISNLSALEGKSVQVGLAPNPRVGLLGEDINDGGGGGRYGVFFGKEVVRGGKLTLAQNVVQSEIAAAKTSLEAVRQKVITDVRKQYYLVLVSNEMVRNSKSLVDVSSNALAATNKLYEAKEAPHTTVLQAELEYQNSTVTLRQAKNRLTAARRSLGLLIGIPEKEIGSTVGSLKDLEAFEDFEKHYQILVNSSPELAEIYQQIETEKRNLIRQQAEVIPNVTWQASVQFDTVTYDVITGFQIGIPLQRNNRNQGSIIQARNQITARYHSAQKKKIQLRQQLTASLEKYFDAKIQVESYQKEILPKAKKTLDLVAVAYSQGETNFIQLLTAQRTYSNLKLQFLEKLKSAWEQQNEIKGLLLSGSLN